VAQRVVVMQAMQLEFWVPTSFCRGCDHPYSRPCPCTAAVFMEDYYETLRNGGTVSLQEQRDMKVRKPRRDGERVR
jgi:hypothetical protein